MCHGKLQAFIPCSPVCSHPKVPPLFLLGAASSTQRPVLRSRTGRFAPPNGPYCNPERQPLLFKWTIVNEINWHFAPSCLPRGMAHEQFYRQTSAFVVLNTPIFLLFYISYALRNALSSSIFWQISLSDRDVSARHGERQRDALLKRRDHSILA